MNRIEDDFAAELQAFIDSSAYTGAELKQAYLVFCEVESLQDIDSKNVESIYGKITEMSDKGCPLNVFISLAEVKIKQVQSVVDRYAITEKINQLNVSNKEKLMLESIVFEKRLGELEVYINSKYYIHLEMYPHRSSKDVWSFLEKNVLARCCHLADPKLEFFFEEV